MVNRRMQRNFFENMNIESWIDWYLSDNACWLYGGNEWPLLFREIAKRVWTARNKQVMQEEGPNPFPDQIVKSASKTVKGIRDAEALRRRRSISDDHG